MWNANKIKNRSKLIDAENILVGHQEDGGQKVGDQKVQIASHKNSYRDIKYRIWNTVNNIITTTYGDR